MTAPVPPEAWAHSAICLQTESNVPGGAASSNGLKARFGSGFPLAIVKGKGGPGRCASETTRGAEILGHAMTVGSVKGGGHSSGTESA